MKKAKDESSVASESRPPRRPTWFSSLLKLRFFSDGMPKISPQAAVDPTAEIADDVQIGPFCVIGPNVKIGPGCRLLNSVTIMGHTTLGRDNLVFPNVVLGGAPQDKKYRGEPTQLIVGDGNVLRESVSIHVGTVNGGGITRVGNNNLLMVNVHLGHDVQFGSNCIIANNCMIAGHVVVGDYVAMMGGAGIHHKTSIGDYAFIGGYARIHHDVPPFVKVDAADEVRGLNSVGLRRAGFTSTDIAALEQAARQLFYNKQKPFNRVLSEYSQQIDRNGDEINPHVKTMIQFLVRRDQGRNGRYLDQRAKPVAAESATVSTASTDESVSAGVANRP